MFNRKKKLVLLFLLVICSICNAQNKKLEINGKLIGLKDGSKITLAMLNDNGISIADSTLAKKGSFHLQFDVPNGPRYFFINFWDKKKPIKEISLFANNDNVLIRCNLNISSIKSYNISDFIEITGCKSNRDNNLIKYLGNYYMSSGDGGNRDRYIQKVKDSLGSESIETKIALRIRKYFMDGFFDVLNSQLILNHNQAVPELIWNISSVDPSVLSEPSLLKLYDKLDLKTKSSYYGKILQQAILKFPGNPAPDFDSTTLGGMAFNLKNNLSNNKYTLVDFWASYCKPCRAENPNLIDQYKKFHEKGFEIISVSLDTDPAIWKKCVDQDKLTWPQVSDLKGANEGPTAKLYGANNGIPLNVLIDSQGKIVAWNLFGEDLRQQLNKLFNPNTDNKLK